MSITTPATADSPLADGRVPHSRVAIVGTGFAGLGLAIRLKRDGIDDFVVFEREDDVGGTWRDNTYPGCQCDVPSHLYSFSFAMNPDWSRTYSPQPEIWEYLRACSREFDVLPHVRFNHEVRGACWDHVRQKWEIETTGGRHTADVLVFGNGALAEPAIPDLPGLEQFEGEVFHSARWNHDHDLTNKRVAVIGTGASAIQIVPKIQPRVSNLAVFQRTPAWVVPHTDRPIRRWERRLYRRVPAAQRLVRSLIYWLRELLVIGMVKNPGFMGPVERIARAHLRRQVTDPELRERLTPDFSPGCKRLLLSDDFYPALQAENVSLVTDGIREVRPSSIVTEDGSERPVDTIIMGTGFRVTDNPMMELIRGADGRSVADAWRDGGARAYLGTTVSGFPNLLLLTGPNTGIGHTSLVVMIEAQVAYVVDCLRYMKENGVASVDVRPEVLDGFNDEIHEHMRRSVWSTGGCASWYLDDHGRNTTLWPDFTWKYRRRMRRFEPADYTVVVEPRSTGQPLVATEVA